MFAANEAWEPPPPPRREPLSHMIDLLGEVGGVICQPLEGRTKCEWVTPLHAILRPTPVLNHTDSHATIPVYATLLFGGCF